MKTSKKNIKLYLKQKETITALSLMLVFIVLLSIMFIPSISNKKGISDEFENYPITYMSSNNYSVVYAASDNQLFYSQNKKQKSSLNDFAHIEDYYNDYGDPTSHIYNFIRINYNFPSKIIKVDGIADNIIGAEGETLVLTEDGNLYMISNRSTNVDLLFRNIKDFSCRRDYHNKINIYMILDNDNLLSKCYFKNNELYKEDIYKGNISSFYYAPIDDDTIKDEKIIINENDNLYVLNKKLNENINYSSEKLTSYVTNSASFINDVTKEDLNIKSNKLVNNDSLFYSLYDGKLTVFEYDLNINKKEINSSIYIDDIYTTGENALIIISDDNLYYYGLLKYLDEAIDEILPLNIKDGLVYGSRNALFKLDKKGYINIYDENNKSFDVMYKRVLTSIILKVLFIFLITMTAFYLIVSFLESNKRYNRYFAVNNKK